MLVVCDVDLCVVDVDLAWLKHLQTSYKNKLGEYKIFQWGEVKDYNLASYFPELTWEEAFDSFWSDDGLYKDLVPKEGCVEALKSFHEKGDKVIFASYCKKGHYGGKYDWLKDHFPFMEGFLATKEKQYVKADIFIDDRNDMLNRVMEEDNKVITIKIDTEYSQKESLIRNVDLVTNNWENIKRYSLNS